MKKSMLMLSVMLLLASATGSQATLIDLGPGSFTALAPVITFDEVTLGTTNPTYNFPALTGLGNVSVSFGGFFKGQAATGGSVVTLSDNTPLTGVYPVLDPNAPLTTTVNDSAPGATSPVLSGTPTFNGPISVLFSVPVAGVGLKGGFFDAEHATAIEAYDSLGGVLGRITNSVKGFEFYGLGDSTGLNVIAGISFFITGSEPYGFQIDNLTFGAKNVINAPIDPVPEPTTFLLLGMGLTVLAGANRMKIKK